METAPFEQKRVLLMDDDPNLREIYTMKLTHEGFDVVSAKDGAEGLWLLQGELPDVVLLDLQMPVKNGLDVLAAMHQEPRLARLPVIILSNVDTEETMRQVGRYETRFYLVKAFTTPEKVAKVIREVLH